MASSLSNWGYNPTYRGPITPFITIVGVLSRGVSIPIKLTTRMITCLLGDPNLNLHFLLLRGHTPKYTYKNLSQRIHCLTWRVHLFKARSLGPFGSQLVMQFLPWHRELGGVGGAAPKKERLEAEK